MPSTFLGITTGSKLYLTSQLKINLILWLDEAFINAGMYRRLPTSGELDYAGNILTQLNPITDARYPSGTYWEARTNNWVYESGLAIQTGFTEPLRPSGIYLRVPGGSYTFYASGTANGNYNYKFDFKKGSVRFTNNDVVPPESTIIVPHTYKEVHVDLAGNERFKQIAYSDTKNETLGSGTGFPTDNQVQLPAVFIQHIDRRWKPLALGGNKIALDNIVMHVFAENETDRDQICDILDGLQSKSIKLADFNSSPFPLDDNGEPNPAYPNLDTLQTTNFYRNCYFKEVDSSRFDSNTGFYRGQVNMLLEILSFN